MLAFDKLRTRSHLTALALGGLACALAGCGGSESDKESTGGGMLQGSGTGSPTTGSGTPARINSGSTEEMGDCGVDGATVQLLSPTPGEDVNWVEVVGDNIIYGLASGLYRIPVGDSSAKAEKFAEGNFESSFLVGDRIGNIRTVDGAPQLTWVPVAGGAPETVSLPAAAEGRWVYDAARNSFFAVTDERPFSYLRYDLDSGQTEQFATELMTGSNVRVYSTPSAYVAWFSSGLDNVDSLYRIDKGTTSAVKLDLGTDQFEPRILDDESIFFELTTVTPGVPDGIYRMPLDGSAPPVRVDELTGNTQTMRLYETAQGKFAQYYDGRTNRVFPVGGPMAGVTLFEYSCETSNGLAVDQNNLYLVVSPRSDFWLLTVPRP